MKREFSPENIKAIMFDFGGTIDGNGISWEKRLFDLLRSESILFDEKIFLSAYKPINRKMMIEGRRNTIRIRDIIDEQITMLAKELETLSIKITSRQVEKITSRFIADTKNVVLENKVVLEKLRLKRKLGIVSNFYGCLKRILIEYGINHIFRVVIDSGEVGVRKPNQDIFLLGLEELDCQAREVVYVGDSYEKDIVPAQRIGLRTIWITDQKEPKSVFHSTETISDISQLVSIFGEQ